MLLTCASVMPHVPVKSPPADERKICIEYEKKKGND